MKRILYALVLLLAPPWLAAQSTAGPFTINASTSPCAVIATTGKQTVGISVTGTFSLTLQPEVSIRGQAPQNTQVTPANSQTAQATITTANNYVAPVAGYDTFFLCVSSYVSGTATIYLNAVNQQNAAVLGGGSGSAGSSGQIITKNLLAEYKMTECTGTTIFDDSGNGNNGTFGATAPTWANTTNCLVLPPYSGVQFTPNSTINLPAALNNARTFYLVTTFIPAPTDTAFFAPLSGSGASANNIGIVFFNLAGAFQGGLPYPFSGAGQYAIGLWNGSTAVGDISNQSAIGTQAIAITLGSASDSPATKDQLWVNNGIAPFNALPPTNFNNFTNFGGQAAGINNATYQLGGSASGKLFTSFPSFFKGYILYFAAYSTFHTPTQVAQNMQAIVSQMASRGVRLGNYFSSLSGANWTNTNYLVSAGDSAQFGSTTSTNYDQFMNLTSGGTWAWANVALEGSTAAQQENDNYAMSNASWLPQGGGNEALMVGLSSNDCFNGTSPQQSFQNFMSAVRAFKKQYQGSYKTIISTTLSRTGTYDTTCKNVINPLIRQMWPSVADALADEAADPNIGANGANASTTFFTDANHPTTQAQANDMAPIVQRAVNRVFGNNSWSTANTYTTTAAAATATTAGSESTNTVTITFGATPANCQVGNQITLAGITPSNYNGVWQILTRTTTQITFFLNATGVGNITVQGTGVCPVQQDADVYTILAGSATSPSFTLESCVGWTGQNIYLKNANTTSPWVITPFQTSETIDGATSLTMPTASSGNNPVVVLQAQIISDTAGGCTWRRMQ